MKIHSKFDALIPIDQLMPHPKNRNKHSPAQIRRLAKLMDKLGVRSSVTVAKAPFNCIAKGHGTVEAFRANGWTEVPVVFQEFADAQELYNYVQSDNAIAEWAEMDIDAIREDVGSLPDDFDTDLLGFEDFERNPESTNGVDPELEWSKEIDERNDYIVLLFNDKKDFEVAKEKLGLRRVNISLSPSGREDFVTQGLGRIIDGNKVIDRL